MYSMSHHNVRLCEINRGLRLRFDCAAGQPPRGATVTARRGSVPASLAALDMQRAAAAAAAGSSSGMPVSPTRGIPSYAPKTPEAVRLPQNRPILALFSHILRHYHRGFAASLMILPVLTKEHVLHQAFKHYVR